MKKTLEEERKKTALGLLEDGVSIQLSKSQHGPFRRSNQKP